MPGALPPPPRAQGVHRLPMPPLTADGANLPRKEAAAGHVATVHPREIVVSKNCYSQATSLLV